MHCPAGFVIPTLKDYSINIDDTVLRGLAMQVTVKKWGNSASVCIPVSVMEAAHLTLDAVVDVREEDGRIIIEPVRQPDYDLDGLLAGITPDNLHDELGFGPAVGKEEF